MTETTQNEGLSPQKEVLSLRIDMDITGANVTIRINPEPVKPVSIQKTDAEWTEVYINHLEEIMSDRKWCEPLTDKCRLSLSYRRC